MTSGFGINETGHDHVCLSHKFSGVIEMNRIFKAIFAAFLLVSISVIGAVAQNDVRRSTVAITYPLNQTITLGFRGTSRLPPLKGEAKVKRQGRRGTRVELSIANLPRAYEL